MAELSIHNTVDGWDLKAPFRGKVSIGSGDGNMIVLAGPGVDQKQCLVFRKKGRFFLRNLGEELAPALWNGLDFGLFSITFRRWFGAETQRFRAPIPPCCIPVGVGSSLSQG